MPAPDEKTESLIRELPDPEGARLFYERVTASHARAARAFARDEGLLSDALTLAAWSPLLGTTLEQNPDYLNWLARERSDARAERCDGRLVPLRDSLLQLECRPGRGEEYALGRASERPVARRTPKLRST